MHRAMERLDSLVRRRRGLVLVAWVVLLLASLPFAARQTENLTNGGFNVPGSGSEKVDKALADFDRAQKENLAVVLALKGGDAAGVRAELERVQKAADEIPSVSLSPAARQRAEREAGTSPIAVVPLEVAGSRDQTADAAVDLRKELDVGSVHQGVEVHLVGQQALWAGMQDLSKDDLASAEKTGFPIVFVILLAVFGSLAAASLPLALGLGSVLLTGAGIFFISQTMEMSVFTTNVASMIGIGVAVDYSLFILARYREEVKAGASPEDARSIAMQTSGIAVAFSGITVMVSLAGLFLVPSQTIRSMALGAIIVVAFSILTAVTLLPALMSLMGRRAYARGRAANVTALVFRRIHMLPRRRGSTSSADVRTSFWQRWTERVMRRPVLAALLSAGALLTLAVPALSLKWGDGALRQFPKDNETRVGAELASKATGPGAAGPSQVVARFQHGTATTPGNRAAVESYVSDLKRDPEVASVLGTQASRDGRSVLITLTPRHDPESPAARGLLDRLREHGGPGGQLERRADVEVGGATGQIEDFKDLVSGSMWKLLLFVMGLSYLVLLVLLRSAVLPLKAVLMNLLSVAAAYGVLVAVFQYGWLDGLLGYHSLGYINTLTPPFLLAIVFGLSMDYEVFLLTRIRERYDATGDTRRAIGEGLAGSARTISSAALIMVSVFAVFAGTGVPSVKEIGLGLAVAIALDATLVRLVLVPATMQILGRWNWWLPKPLARVLPKANFEVAPGKRAPAGA